MSPRFRTGLVVLGVLAAADLAMPLLTDGDHPPMSIALIAAALGVASVAMIVSARRGARRAVRTLVALRAVSAAMAVPAFFEGAPVEAVVSAVAVIALTVVGAALVLTPARQVVTS